MHPQPRTASPRITSLLLALSIAAACDADAARRVPPAGEAPARASNAERQAELIAKAAAEAKAGNVEPAIAAYLDAEKLGALDGDDARAFAAALRTNGAALLTKGDLRRALANFTKAVAVVPEETANATALAGWMTKWDEANALYSEDALATSLADDLPGDLAPAAKTAIAGVYIDHAAKLTNEGRDPLRATKVFEAARGMDAEHPRLESALAEAKPKLAEQMRAAMEVDAAVGDYLAKHPGVDAIPVIAKRRKVDPATVREAVEMIATVRQDLLDRLASTRWGVVADVEASVVRRTSLGGYTAELNVVLTGCDPADHDVLALAALKGIVDKLPASVDSLRAPISYKGLSCSLTRAGLVATWRRGDSRVTLAPE